MRSAVACAAPAYLAARGTPRTVADLKDHNCLGYTLSRAVGHRRWIFGPAGDIAVDIAGAMVANSGDALVAAAVAGMGIVYQPVFLVADELRAGRLVTLTLDHPPVEIGGVHAVYPSERRPPAKVRLFIDFLVERIDPRRFRRGDGFT